MNGITDITSLGTEYTITNPEGSIVTSIQVVTLTDILSATLGAYTEEFGSYSNYLEKSVSLLSGLEGIDPYSVLWYATSDEEVLLEEVFEYAIQNNYTKIILEHLEELE